MTFWFDDDGDDDLNGVELPDIPPPSCLPALLVSLAMWAVIGWLVRKATR